MSRRLSRRPPRIEPRSRLLIVCEGKVTEPHYFGCLRHKYKSRLVDVEIVPDRGVPRSVVDYAVDRKRESEREARRRGDPFLRFDEVWCVFDTDNHPNLAEAKDKARANGVCTAVSSPCFELWLLLHFQDQRAAQTQAQIQAQCRVHLPRYVKEIPFNVVDPLYGAALARARELEHWHSTRGTPETNPYTKVHNLTERIVALGREQLLTKARGH